MSTRTEHKAPAAAETPTRATRQARGAGAGRALAIAGAVAFVLLGCSTAEQGGAAASATPSAVAPATAASSAAAPAGSAAPGASGAAPAGPAALAGQWSGSGTVERVVVATQKGEGEHPLWKRDDGTQGAGKVQLTLEVAPDGTVRGTCTGALGALAATGLAEPDLLTARIEAAPPAETGFAGTLRVTLEGGTLSGTLNAASLDGALLRKASVTLTRSAGAAASAH